MDRRVCVSTSVPISASLRSVPERLCAVGMQNREEKLGMACWAETYAESSNLEQMVRMGILETHTCRAGRGKSSCPAHATFNMLCFLVIAKLTDYN